MAAFLDLDLEQIAQIVERGRGLAEMALLLDGRRLGIALDHDQPAQHGAMLARDFLPGRLAKMLAERNDAVFLLRRQQDAPAIIRHLDIVELGPAARVDGAGGAQINQRLLETSRPHVAPPVHVAGMPAFQRLEHLPILAEIHVVGNLGRVIDIHDVDVHLDPPVLGGLVWRMANGEWRMETYSLFATRYSPFTPASYRTAPSGRCRSA